MPVAIVKRELIFSDGEETLTNRGLTGSSLTRENVHKTAQEGLGLLMWGFHVACRICEIYGNVPCN